MIIRELAAALQAEFAGDGEREITAVMPLEEAGASDLSFVSNMKFAQLALTSVAGCLVIPPGIDVPGKNLIFAKDPRAAVAQLIPLLHPIARPGAGIHPSAVIHPEARVHETASIGPFCSVGPRCAVGAQTILYPRVCLYRDVQVGDRCVLHSGVVLGADGFGFVWRDDHYENFPQVGKVSIGNDVEIGANSCIDRAALGVTSIGDGTKIDNICLLYTSPSPRD